MRKRRKRARTNLIILLLLAVLLLVVLFLFRVRKVTVSGNSRYSAEEIEEGLLTDFLSGNTLYLWWSYRDGAIPDTMPYLESMEITVNSPVSITVTVTEKELIGYFDTGSYVYFDENGIVLEITDESYDDIPIITGASLGEVTLYQKVPTESSSLLRTILSLLDLLDFQELTAKEIRFADDSEITVYIGNIEALLGQDEYLEEKIANLKAILSTMSDSAAGTLHLENVTGNNEDIVFSPADETEAETETEENDTAGEDTSDTGTGASGDTSTIGGAVTDDSALTGTADDSGNADSDSANSDSSDSDSSDSDSSDSGDSDADDSSAESTTSADVMAFNSSGQLIHNVRIQDGVVVDSSGNAVDGCYVNDDGNIVDAYQNIIDPATGDALNLQ